MPIYNNWSLGQLLLILFFFFCLFRWIKLESLCWHWNTRLEMMRWHSKVSELIMWAKSCITVFMNHDRPHQISLTRFSAESQSETHPLNVLYLFIYYIYFLTYTCSEIILDKNILLWAMQLTKFYLARLWRHFGAFVAEINYSTIFSYFFFMEN